MTVGERQNQPEMLLLLYARNKLTGRLKIYQGIFLGITLLLPAISFVMTNATLGQKAMIALTALGFGLIDASLFDPWQKKQLKISAKLQEQFDCYVMGIPWNSFVVGPRVDPEILHSIGRPQPAELANLRDWHSGTISELNTVLSALVCQRSNLWYDSVQRRLYLSGLLIVVAVIAVIFTAGEILHNATLANAALATTPLVAFLNWAARENARQKATIETALRLKSEIEGIWNRLHTADEVVTSAGRVRELQDAIFQHRSTSPLIFDWVYNRLRSKLDSEMKAGAEDWVKQLKDASREGI